MGANQEVVEAGRSLVLLPATAITIAGTVLGAVFPALDGIKVLELEAIVVYSSGGTTIKGFVQTTLDKGVTWIDIACFAFTTAAGSKVSKVSVYAAVAAGVTPTDKAMADNTILDGVLGNQLRAVVVSTGTYAAATTITINCQVKG